MVRKNGFKGLIGIPLLVHDRVLGGIFTARHRRESQPYSPDDISFLQSIAGPLALAIENARLFDQAKDHRQRLRGISQRLVKLQEDQFKQLGQELHDHIGQDLTAIHINLSLIESMLPENTSDALRQRLANTNHLVTESVAHIRNIMSDFLPPMLEHYGLTAALLWYAQKFTNCTKIIVTVNDYNLKDLRLASDIELSLFRITQEALNNIAKHAQATQAEIELKDTGDYIVLSIRDNGIGFNLRDVLARQGEHWGLSIMKERARAINASFNITSVVREGTKITMQVLRNQ
jgi:signal transduction histidine kinase